MTAAALLAHRDTLRAILKSSGVRAAVEFLNSLTPHRFSSFFRFDGPLLRSVVFYDRENPRVETCEDLLVEASYCVFVRDHCQNFTVADAGSDDRVADHPKRASILRYCGVPLLDGDGKLFGSMCHFDFSPGEIAPTEVELMEHLAHLLQPTLR